MTTATKNRIRKINAQFLTDAKGKRTSVLLSVKAYEELLEDLVDLAAVAERRGERTYTMEEVEAMFLRGSHA